MGQKCRRCGCTTSDCSRCTERTGAPCSWVENDLCSACVEPSRLLVWRSPDDSPLSSVVLDATGPALFAAEDGGQYVTDLFDLGMHLVEDLLDGLAPGPWVLTGRTLATRVHHDGSPFWQAEDPWTAERATWEEWR